MAFIQKTIIPLSFQGGLESKTDALQLQPPSLLSLSNAKFDKLGALNKRPGYDILSRNVLSQGIINSAVAIDSFNNELNLFDNKNIYTYIDAVDSWANRGPAISLINTNQSIVRVAAAQQLNPDSVSLNNINVYVWEDSRGTCRYSVLDQVTQSYCVADLPLQGSTNRPKVLAFNNLIYILYTNNNNLYFRTINTDNPGPAIITNQINLISDGYADFRYDACVTDSDNFGTRLFISYFSNADNLGIPVLTYFYLDTNNVKSTPIILASGDDALISPDVNCVNVVGDSLGNIWNVWSTGNEVRASVADQNLDLLLNNVLIDGYIACPNIGSIESINTGSLQIAYEIKDFTNSSDESCKSVILKVDGTINQVGQILSVGLASKPFRYNNNIFINLTYQSNLQSTYFTALLTNSPFTIVGKISPDVGGGLRTNGLLAEINQNLSGVITWANLVKGQFISEDNTSFSLLGVNNSTSDFTSPNKFNSVTFSNNLLFVGGITQNYDGVSVNEQNFHIYPEDIIAIPNGNDGQLSAGQYQYQVVYAWTDKYGQIQYSSPSPTVTVTTIQNNHVELVIPTVRLSAKTGIVIKIYRTQVNGVVFQEVTSELAPLKNNPIVNAVIFTDVASDISIQANQTIYTTGGVLPNAAPPSCSLISLYNDRVILAGLEDPNLLWVSKNKANNSNFNTIPVEFSQELTVSINQLGGSITALGLMDQNLVIFKKSAIFVMSGDGPNDAGGGNQFQDPQLITQSVGCANPNSVVLTGQGIMFQTPNKGIWLLDRSLGPPQYIGAGVDDIAKQYLVSSAVLDINSNSVIFTTYNGPAMVYDYLIGQWATWTNHQSIDAINWNDEFVFCKNNGSVYKQNPEIFYDGYVSEVQIPYNMEVITPWMSYSQVLGYQSIFRTFILGQYKGAHSLDIAVGYNFNPYFENVATIDATSLIGNNVWGADVFWGESTPWGGTWQPYIFQVNMQIQKCTSFRIKLNDVETAPYNEGFTLSSLLFELGVMPDGIRIPVTNKVGARAKS